MIRTIANMFLINSVKYMVLKLDFNLNIRFSYLIKLG